VVARPVAAAAAPASEIAPSQKTKFGRGPKEARAAKAAKKAAKKAARQAERKTRAKSNNKAAVRATAAARERQADLAPMSATARAGGPKSARSSMPESAHRTGGSQRETKSTVASAARATGGVRALSTTMLVLVAAVLVLAGLGWFLASRR